MLPDLDYDALDRLLAKLGSEQSPEDFHGLLCGSLCAYQANELDLADLLEFEDGQSRDIDANSARLLRDLGAAIEVSLQDVQMGFMPLLPDDEADLNERVDALVAWCEGFLFGLSSRPSLNLEACSEEVQEIVRDFTDFTRAGLGGEEDDEVEENAYAELIEYIRVGVQLVFIELRNHGNEPDRPTLH